MSRSSHASAIKTSPEIALESLFEFEEQWSATHPRGEDFDEYEKQLKSHIDALHCAHLAEGLSRCDVDTPLVLLDGIEHRQVVRCEATYISVAGPIRVTRSLYSNRSGDDPSICPLELRAGIVEGRYTPHAAELALWTTTHLTPMETEELFQRVGGMTPSRSSLDRLPKQVSEHWEARREHFEDELRRAERVPDEAATVAVSLDGVMVPMLDGKRPQKRAQAKKAGKLTRGPAGYREASCATLSFYDKDGQLLSTIRLGRMPEARKATLKGMLAAELLDVVRQRPNLRLVKVADGARDNWTYLSDLLPKGDEVVDYYHACEHLHAAAAMAYGERSPRAKTWYDKWRSVLRHEDDGVDKVIRAIAYQAAKHPRRKKLKRELTYFRRNRQRMDYARLSEQALPIGSGIVEAACKTLVTQRLKRSGMRWRHDGGQAILTLRSLVQSDRFDRGWELLRSTYAADVRLPDNVIPLNARAKAADVSA